MNKQLQELIGSLINKDYFKLEKGSKFIMDGIVFTAEYNGEFDNYKNVSYSK